MKAAKRFIGWKELSFPASSRSVGFQNPAWRQGLAALVIAHLLAILAMAASPRLHKWIHHDADAPGHECAVMLFTHGGSTDAPAIAVVIVAWIAVPLLLAEKFRPVWVKSRFLSFRILEHAPPALS